jgi:hypothetical protein
MRNAHVLTALALPLALALGACGDAPTAPGLTPGDESSFARGNRPPGSGLDVDIVGTVTLPVVGGATVTITDALITNIALVESTVGGIFGLEVQGTLTGTRLDAVGGLVSFEAVPFTADLAVTSSGPGQCSLVMLNLTDLDASVLGLVDVTVPATFDVKGSGAVGSLLCNLGSIVGGLLGGGAGGLVNAINNQI